MLDKKTEIDKIPLRKKLHVDKDGQIDIINKLVKRFSLDNFKYDHPL